MSVFLCLPIVLLDFILRLAFLRLSILYMSFFLGVGVSFTILLLWGVPRHKIPHLLFKILLDFENISIGYAQGRDVQKIHLCLDVYMYTATTLEHHMLLRVFDTHLGVQGMEDISELWHCLVSFY